VSRQATDDVVAALDGLASLRELNVGGRRVSDVALERLHLPALRKLAIRGCPGIEVLHLSRLPRLEVLDAQSSGLRALYCTGAPKLRIAVLSQTRVTRHVLSGISVLPEMRELDIANTPLTGDNLALLPQGLEELRIDFTVLDEPGIAHLARLPGLKHVALPRATRDVERGRESRLRRALPGHLKVSVGPLGSRSGE
jgi:hypothetical protein